MFGPIMRLLRRGGAKSREFHIPNLNLRDLTWDDLADFAQGPGRARESRVGVLLPTMLTVAGAGATLWWWRQWAQGSADSQSLDGAEPKAAAVEGLNDAYDAVILPPSTLPVLDAGLAVQGAPDSHASDKVEAQA